MSAYGFSIGITPAASTPKCLTYSLDFSTMNMPVSNPVRKPYIEPFGNTLPFVTQFANLSLQLPNTGDPFGNIRSVAFQFRPYKSSLGDYQQNPGKVRYDKIPYVVLYNSSTMQALYIQAKSLILPNASVAAAVTSYVPLLLVHQGAAPFFATLQDQLEVALVNINSDNLGKLVLNFFNFDVAPWYETTFDQLVTAN